MRFLLVSIGVSIECPLSVHWVSIECPLEKHKPNHQNSNHQNSRRLTLRLLTFCLASRSIKWLVSWHNQPLHDHIQVVLPSMSPYGSQSGLQLIRLFSFSFGSSSTACVLTQPRVAWPHPCCQKHNVSICLWVKSCLLNPHMSIDARYSRNCVLNPHILGPSCFTSGGSIQIAGLQHVKLNVQICVSQRSTLVIT